MIDKIYRIITRQGPTDVKCHDDTEAHLSPEQRKKILETIAQNDPDLNDDVTLSEWDWTTKKITYQV